ncbi:hypothetical protein HPP92_011311 [Vanilla planifolia]|uniref:Uncharacterized protein n=1 Tax=Vanilla planifolia TaxID=51239 RepID=A0A835RB85_VANPL|nr:hypothetical protein HPP92_011616 [Vanilla planifolia]KAG0483227.1 hypothetical protein HPP92_011311 [Vanilla planifolia]
MEIASCCPVLWHLPICCRPHPLSICSSVSLPVSPLRVHCSLSCRGCNDVSSIRISLFRSLRKCGLHFGSFQTKCSSHSTMNGSAVETDDYQQDFLKNVLGSEGATVLEKDHEVFQDDDDAVSKYQIDNKMVKVCDKLIVIFMVDKPTTTDWRRLLAFSKNWENLRPYFFIHCQKRADSESDPEMKQKLLRLHRKLKEIDDDVQRHNELLNLIKGAPDDIISIVTKRRKDFTNEFFVHLHNVAQSYFDNPTEQNAHTKLANDCLAALKAFDTAAESMQAVAAAELKFKIS